MKFTITQGFCNRKVCVRGLHKIAFEVFALKIGLDEALKPLYDAVRAYVMRGEGDRIVLWAQASNSPDYRNCAYTSDGSVFPRDVVTLELAFIGFSVDLSPDQGALQALKDKHNEVLGTNWTWAPIDEK
ncbi:MAG: hypothetical protein ACREJC_18205 [Tepidisphaeraceae bacterium]